MLRFVALVAAVTVCLGATPASATKVAGKVTVTKEFREALAAQESANRDEKTSGYWNEPNAMVPVEPPLVDPSRDIGVVLFKEGAKPPKADELSTVNVRAGGMERSVIVRRPGSTVRFQNVDPFDHELHAPGIEIFKPERQSRGAFRPIEFAKEGVFEIKCRLIPHFKAYVVVTPAQVVLDVKESGDFTLDELEPGKYTLKVFHGGKWVHEQAVVVEDQKEQRVEVKVDVAGKAAEATAPDAAKDAKDAKSSKKK